MTDKNRAWATLTFEGTSTEQSIVKQHTLSPTEATTIGRAPNCKIILDPDKFTTVSRRHAEIKFTGAVWKINDLGSTNGTLVNNRPIKDWQLKSGDRITLGIQGPEFTFECLALNTTVTAQPSKLNTDKIKPQPPVSKSFTRLDLAMPELSADASIIPELKIIPKQDKDNIESEAEDKPVNPSESVDLELEPVVKSPIDVEPSPAKLRSTEEKEPLEAIGETIPYKSTSVEIKSPPSSTAVFSYHKTLWNLISITELLTVSGHSETISAIAFSPDGRTLASAANQTIKLWNVAEGTEIANLTEHKLAVNALAFSPDGKTLASAGEDKTIKLWNLTKEIASFSAHQRGINALAFSPDGKTLASAGEDKIIKLWNLAQKEEAATFTGHQQGINALAFSPDGQTLASGSRDKTIKLWNLAQKEETATFTGHQQGINALAFSPDGRAIASAGADRTIKLWKRSTETEIMAIALPSWQMGAIAFAPDGKTVASSDEQNAVRLWQI